VGITDHSSRQLKTVTVFVVMNVLSDEGRVTSVQGRDTSTDGHLSYSTVDLCDSMAVTRIT